MELEEQSLYYSEQNATVIGIDKNKSSLQKLQKKIKKNLLIKNIDCTNSAEIKNSLKDINKIDGLVNCAGIVPQGNILECSEKEWLDTIETNLTSIFLITKYFMKKFISQKKGSIVNISSSIKGVRRFAYSSSKAGIIGLTKSIAVDYAKMV